MKKELLRLAQTFLGVLCALAVPTAVFRIKRVATELLARQATGDAVKTTVLEFLWSDETGLPAVSYDQDEVSARADVVYRHIYARYQDAKQHVYAR